MGDESGSEEELDGGVLVAPTAPAAAPDDDEDIGSGLVDSVSFACAAATPAAADAEEDEIDGGVVEADMFGPNNADYQRTSIFSVWRPPRRGPDGRSVVITKRSLSEAAGAGATLVAAKKPRVKSEAAAGSAPTSANRPRGETGSRCQGSGATAVGAPPPPPLPLPTCAHAGVAAAEPAASSLGERMMASMGFRKGAGLGRDEQGRTSAPVEHSNLGNLGLGYQKGGDGSDGGFRMHEAVAAPLGQVAPVGSSSSLLLTLLLMVYYWFLLISHFDFSLLISYF